MAKDKDLVKEAPQIFEKPGDPTIVDFPWLAHFLQTGELPGASSGETTSNGGKKAEGEYDIDAEVVFDAVEETRASWRAADPVASSDFHGRIL